MLRTTLIVSVMMLFLVHQCLSSPVYTMQPAYITANIGASTGRNIRRLPCVSRKSGMTGTCMFAIDCLKANGTHLGTCIDRFYFGSCCHIEPGNDLSDNVIDTAIMPDRQPPYRISSTTEKASLPANTTMPTKTTILTTQSISTRPGDSNVATSTPKTVITITRRPSPSVGTTEKFITSQMVSTQGAVTKPKIPLTTMKPISDIISTIKETKVATTTESYKLSTFQSVDDGTEQTTVRVKPTIKPTITTSKPVSTKPKPRPTVKPVVYTTKPTQTRPTVTTKPSTKPIIKPTTKIPVTRPGTVKPTVKPTKITTTTGSPIKTSTTVKPVKVITTKRPSTTQKITTSKPITTKITTTAKPITTTTVTTTTTTAKPITTTTSIPSTTKQQDSIVEETRPQSTSSFISNEVLVTSTKVPLIETVNGNTATNEIESIEQPTPEKSPEIVITTDKATTQMQGLVTWAMISNNEQTTKASINISHEDPENEWTPITPPDGWVLLPSVSTTTQQVTNDAPTTVTSATQSTIPQSTTTTTTTIKDDDTSQTTSLPISTTSISPSSDNKTTETLELVPLLNISTSTTTQQTTSTPSSMLPTDEAISTIPTPKPVNMSDHTDVCGRRMYPEPRIVGGEKSTFGKWPWQISLRQWKTSTYLHKCGAALLNENWAITAAHCVENVPPSDLLLRLGEHDLSTDSEPYIHQERRVQIVASHPQFDPRTFEYDLALLRFYEPVQFQPNIIPVCVPQDDESFVGRNAHVTGWGRLYEDGPLPSVLQEVSVPVINNTVCESMYRNAGYIEHIPNIFICAGWKHGGFDSCEGDSGGPMVIQRPDKRYLLAGIISWGIGCAEPNQPGVYTRISEFRDWINQILQF